MKFTFAANEAGLATTNCGHLTWTRQACCLSSLISYLLWWRDTLWKMSKVHRRRGHVFAASCIERVHIEQVTDSPVWDLWFQQAVKAKTATCSILLHKQLFSFLKQWNSPSHQNCNNHGIKISPQFAEFCFLARGQCDFLSAKSCLTLKCFSLTQLHI